MVEPLEIISVPTQIPQVTPQTDFAVNNRTIVFSTVFPSIFVFTLIVVTRHIIRKRRLRNRVLIQSTSTVYLIPDLSNEFPKSSSDNRTIEENTHVHHGAQNRRSHWEENMPHFNCMPVYKNQEHPVYLVPFTALPTDFDFSSRKVQVCSDFVIVKDLDILQNCIMETPVIQQHEEYQKEVPFNPTFSRNQVMVY